MRPLLALAAITLAGCGGFPTLLQQSAPGVELPRDAMGMCRSTDSTGRCVQFRWGSGVCVNPRGIDAEPVTMPCAEIRAAGLTPLRPAAEPGF